MGKILFMLCLCSNVLAYGQPTCTSPAQEQANPGLTAVPLQLPETAEASYPLEIPSIESSVPQTRFYAVKTNLLFTAVLCANLGFEVELWPRWSLDIPIWYSPYELSSSFKLRLLAAQPEIRWWTKKAGEGHFIGLHTHVAGFDVAFDDRERYQDPDHALWGMGLSYGYAMLLGKTKRWGLEFNLGVGFAGYEYDVYCNRKNGPKIRTGSSTYFGITRAGVSLSYRWNRERKNRKWMGW